MSDPYIGEIRMVSFKFAPYGWALCQGQTMQVGQNQALYSLVGNIYGGTAPATFGLPDLQGRSAIGVGTGQNLTPIALGAKSGAEDTTLTIPQMPVHTHSAAMSLGGASAQISIPATTSTTGESGTPGPATVLGPAAASGHAASLYSTAAPNTTLLPFNAPVSMSVTGLEIGNTGGMTPVGLRNPYLGLNFAIALTGIYPTPD